MRAFVGACFAVGVGGFLATGCSSSTTSDGGTTGIGTTGGVGTTGAATGGTTGATTTGGTSGLSPGSACTANTQCESDVCGIAGTGNCCTSLCSTSDTTCGASGCDSSGACMYHVGTACGTTVCSGGMLTGSLCDATGACAAGTSMACAGNFGCAADGMSCNTSCTTATDCASGFWCSAGACVAVLSDGTACTENDSCTSNVCGTTGTGNCCTAACSTTDATCGATACDTTGACTYPPNTSACGTASCTGNMLTTSACDGTSGTCVAGTPSACPGNFACAADGLSCNTTCTTATDCASGNWCSGGSCVPTLAAGTACTENDSCGSGACGVNGTGNCCSAACTTGDLMCGATACDSSGACQYPAAATPCGTISCIGSTLTSSACDGTGTCASNGGVPCPNGLTCNSNSGGTACNSTCLSNSDCAGTNTNFCDVPSGGCCAVMGTGGSVNVDSVTGSDATTCCGYGSAGACATLTRAMQLVNGTNSAVANPGIGLIATVNGAGGDWTGNNETYPISLGWGVVLAAGSVYFTDTTGQPEIFDIALQSGEAAGNEVIIEGNLNLFPLPPVVIGSDSLGNLTNDPVSINVEANASLNVAAVVVYEPAGSWGIDIQSSATLNIDDHGVLGELQVGGTLPNGTAVTSNMGTGVLCNGTMSDVLSLPFPGAGASFTGEGQTISIDAEDGCGLTLNGGLTAQGPILGWQPATPGYTAAGNGCTGNPTPMDGIGVQANGNATVSISHATVSCMSSWGVTSTNSNSEATTPTVSFSGTIQNCAAAGLYVTAGSVTVPSGTIQDNFIGVDMENDGFDTPSVTLNDGSTNLNTTVTCNSNQEPGVANQPNPGIDVYNNSTGTLNADWVNWDFWFQPNSDANSQFWPDYFWCDNNFSCTCEAVDSTDTAMCNNTAGADGMNLVFGTNGNPPPPTTPNLGAQTASDGNGLGICL